MSHKILVVLPTYNEAENIVLMAESVLRILPTSKVAIVDDNSPDGTGLIAEEFARTCPDRVRVLHKEKKEGLGSAYLYAFRRVLSPDVDYVIQMDTDFSHPPELLPKLVDALATCDFVLASRYVPGGGITNWSLWRKILSWSGNLYARSVLGLRVRDLTGGYKAFHRHVLEKLLQYDIDSQGYSFQIETTSRAIADGFQCREIPFVFGERKSGKSKMSKRIILEALMKTIRLKSELKSLK